MLIINYQKKVSFLIPEIHCECGCTLAQDDFIASFSYEGLTHFVSFNKVECDFTCPCGKSSICCVNFNNNFTILERFDGKINEYVSKKRSSFYE